MFRLIPYIMLSILLSSPIISAPIRSVTGSYYIYEFTHREYKNGELSLNYTVTLKYVEVNDTAYRLELLNYQGPENIKEYIEERIKTLENLTGGIVLVKRGYLPSIISLSTIWIDPRNLSRGREAVAKINNALSRLCSLGNSGGERSRRQEILGELWNDTSVKMILEGMFPQAAYRFLIFDIQAAGLSEDTKYLCNRGLSLIADERSGVYIYKLLVSKTTTLYKDKITGEALYSKNGWLLKLTYDEESSSKRNSNQYTRKIVETIKLVDTNDETLKSTMQNLNSTINNDISSPLLTPVIIAGIIIITATLALIVIVLKR